MYQNCFIRRWGWICMHSDPIGLPVGAQTLTPQQEAYLDTAVHPWWPDMWHITGILDQQSASSNGHGGSRQGMSRRGSKASLSSSPVDHAALDQRAQDVPNLAINIPVLKGMSLLPHSTAMELLTQPLLAKGAGLRLKCKHMLGCDTEALLPTCLVCTWLDALEDRLAPGLPQTSYLELMSLSLMSMCKKENAT